MGRRRSWMLVAQLTLLAGLLAMGAYEPISVPTHMALLAVFTAFASATQDIAVDAYRIEAVGTERQGAMSAAYQTGYQLALLAAGAGALFAAAGWGWSRAYYLMGACALVGILTTLLIAEPAQQLDRGTLAQEARVIGFLERSAHWPASLRHAAAWLIGAVVCPFIDFFNRNGTRAGLPILALIVTYRLNYTTMGVAANSFYIDLGFSLQQIAAISKVYGVLMTLSGALAGGVMVARTGVPRTLLTGLVLLSAANLFYAYIADIHPGIWWLAAAISFDNLGNGIAGAAFIAYMSSLTNSAYTATQYALFGTLWSLPAKTVAGFWGNIVNAVGYRWFFVYTAAVGLPALLLILLLMRRPVAAVRSA